MPAWLAAGLWGGVAGSALLIGAAIGYLARVPQRAIAAVMAFGGGVLVSALSFDLMDEAYRRVHHRRADLYLGHHGAESPWRPTPEALRVAAAFRR
jgi:hypothetical protein